MAVELNRTRKANAGQESSHDIFADTLAELLALTADQLHALSLEPGALALCDDTKSLYVLTELAASGASPGVWNISGGQSAIGFGFLTQGGGASGVVVAAAGVPEPLDVFNEADSDGVNVVSEFATDSHTIEALGGGKYNLRFGGKMLLSAAAKTGQVRILKNAVTVLASFDFTATASQLESQFAFDEPEDLVAGDVITADVDAGVNGDTVTFYKGYFNLKKLT